MREYYALLDPEWAEPPAWLPMQHFRAGGLGDVVLGPTEHWVPGSWALPSDLFAPPPPEPPPPPRNPALRLVATGSGMTAAEWEDWLK